MHAEYVSFLLRMWRERESDVPAMRMDRDGWQGELENVQSGERWRFDSLEELFALLQDQAALVAGPG